MAKGIKISDLSKDFAMKSKEVIEEFKTVNIEKTTGGTVSDEEFAVFMQRITLSHQISDLEAYRTGKVVIKTASEEAKAEKKAEPKAEKKKPAKKQNDVLAAALADARRQTSSSAARALADLEKMQKQQGVGGGGGDGDGPGGGGIYDV